MSIPYQSVRFDIPSIPNKVVIKYGIIGELYYAYDCQRVIFSGVDNDQDPLVASNLTNSHIDLYIGDSPTKVVQGVTVTVTKIYV
jgi:hypothetical protein